MNIIKLLSENNAMMVIHYYGINDFGTGFAIRKIIENSDLIINYYKDKDCSISYIDEYIDYLFLKYIINFDEIISIINDEYKELFSNIISVMKNKYSNYLDKDLAKYIKNNYKDILNDEYKGLFIQSDVIDYTFEFIIRYCYKDKDKDIIKYLISNFSYKIFDNFNSFKKLFNNSDNLEYYDLLLDESNIRDNVAYRLEDIKVVLDSLRNKDINLFNIKVELLVNIFKEGYFNTSIEGVMNTYYYVSNMKKILADLNSKYYYEFEKELKLQEEILNEYISKYGFSTEYEINIKTLIKVYEDENIDWYTKSLIITHSKDKKNKRKLISNLDYIIKYSEKSVLMDRVSSNIATDGKFTNFVINNLSIIMMEGKYAIDYMIHDDKRLNDFLSYIYGGINSYFNNNSLYYNSDYLHLDLDMLLNALIDFKELLKEKDDIKSKWFAYSLCIQINGIIEKTLRNIYYENIKENKYVNSGNATLNYLLSSDEIKKVIGENNCDCLDYYLLNHKGIGKKLRNDFAHYNERIYDKLTYDTVLESLYFLILVSNSLLIKKIK